MLSKLTLNIAGVIGCLLGILPDISFIMQAVGVSTIEQSTFGSATNELMLFDFTNVSDVDNWIELSDTVRTVGMSKAVMVLQKTRMFQRAIFFSLLNPQPNGAGFASVRAVVNVDLSNYKSIQINARGQGSVGGYKVVLRHRNQDEEPKPTYEQMFDAPMGSFQNVFLPLSDFKPFYRGRELNATETEALDLTHLTNFAIQVYGGVYLPVKQSGSSSLEINYIKAIG